MRIRAKYAWVNGRELAQDVLVEVADGAIACITATAAKLDADHSVDLLLPGFINAHCHLEYTALAGKLPSGKIPFGDWLEAIIDAKNRLTPEQVAKGVRDGIDQLIAGGCTTVVDSTSTGYHASLAASPLRHFVMHEVLGLSAERSDEQLESALRNMQSTTGSRGIGHGINPHAPYSVGPHLRARLRELLAQQPELHCAWHLTETTDEEQLLTTGTGSLADFLQRRNLPFPSAPLQSSAGDSAAVTLLQRENLLTRCDLAFHMNTAHANDFQYLRAPRAVAYCPGTHEYFQRAAYPMYEALAAGANICLGTDSLASSPSLNILEIIRLTAAQHPWLSGPQLLSMVTRNPAATKLLHRSGLRLGSIAPGHAADFVALGIKSAGVNSLRETLCDKATRIQQVWIAGELFHQQ